MPILQFKCDAGFITEQIILSAANAASAPDLNECANSKCALAKPHFARRVEHPLTGAPQFKGDGWTKKGNS